MGYLYDSNKGVYIHEALVDENGTYDAAILNESISSVHSRINNRAKTGKFDKDESKTLNDDGKRTTPRNTNERRNMRSEDRDYDDNASKPNRTQRKHGLKQYLGQTGSNYYHNNGKETDLAVKDNNKLASKRAKIGVKEDFDYSTEFFSNLELK